MKGYDLWKNCNHYGIHFNIKEDTYLFNNYLTSYSSVELNKIKLFCYFKWKALD